MAYAHSAHYRDFAPAQAPARKGKGIFARLLAAMAASRQRQVDREIARCMAGRGDKFTDETEREIERRFLSNASYW